MTTELRCIEGWSTVVHWAGARLADLAAVTGSGDPQRPAADPIGNADDLLGYAALETPDGDYYVGLDMASALHPQTLLCYEMDGQPLTPDHGAPLRLVIPVKYGIKNLKQIGTIRFTDVGRPTTGPNGATTGMRDTEPTSRTEDDRGRPSNRAAYGRLLGGPAPSRRQPNHHSLGSRRMTKPTRILILGGGFAGTRVALHLERLPRTRT